VGEEDVHRRVDLLDDREFVELEVRDLLEEDDDRPGRFPGTTR
jgi:Arc/MetJ family transcription regulator